MAKEKCPKRQRGGYKSAITRIANQLTPEFLASASMSLLLLLEERVMHSFKEYERINSEIDPADEEEPSETESVYFSCVSSIRNRVSELKGPSSQHKTGGCVSKLKLPNIEIKAFDGKYTDYQSFIEMFNALIYNDSDIDDVQKLFYLKFYLKAEAYDLVKNLPVIGSSYKEALDILKERYDNKFKIVSEHINSLFELPGITKSSSSTLRSLISTVKQHVTALKNLGEPTDKWDSILICLLSKKLDIYTSKAYHLEHDQKKAHTFEDFIKFLEGRALAYENSEGSLPVKAHTRIANVAVIEASCINCKLNHKLHVCPKFLLAPVAKRLDFVKKNRLCKICLGGHQGRCKYYFKCQECKLGTHNTLLHSPVINSQAQAQVKEEKKNVSLLSNTNIGYKFQTLMPTAKVKIVGKNGKEFVVRALLDSASDTSFITSNLAKKLGKPLMPNSTDVIGIAKTGKEVKYSIPTLDVFSCVYPYKAQVSNCLVVDDITTKLPHNELDLRKVLIPKNIQLADDSFHIPGEIDLLLPAGIYYRVLLPQPLDLQFGQEINTGRPAFVHTQFGYVVGGDAPISSSNNDAAVALFCHDCNTSTNDDIVSQLSPSNNSSHHFDEESSRDLPRDLPKLKATKPNFSEVVCACCVPK
ncbi:hypothetical protein NE865_15232 [Phthorimaea operculella]|nr:hypothetical protein NE865_15232 [Phthorimaea operculella]